jgi:hypothetical protein
VHMFVHTCARACVSAHARARACTFCEMRQRIRHWSTWHRPTVMQTNKGLAATSVARGPWQTARRAALCAVHRPAAACARAAESLRPIGSAAPVPRKTTRLQTNKLHNARGCTRARRHRRIRTHTNAHTHAHTQCTHTHSYARAHSGPSCFHHSPPRAVRLRHARLRKHTRAHTLFYGRSTQRAHALGTGRVGV